MSEFLTSDPSWGSQPAKTLEQLFEKIRSYFPQADLKVVEKAYYFSEKAHEGQFRRSGEPYISHPLSVAGILADLHLDLDSIVTGILHDTVEDTPITRRRPSATCAATLPAAVVTMST